MERPSLLFLISFVLLIFLSSLYIPSNQLSVYKGSARLEKIYIEDYKFTLAYLHTSQTSNPAFPAYLFIHGHKGDVTQAISMTKFFFNHGLDFNMYSIDFNQGAVGISYSLLKAEVKFTEACIKEIAKRHPSSKIVIIGHSFGGVVGSLALINNGEKYVKGMIALSTPFEAVPVNSDYNFIWEYHRMHNFWKKTKIFVVSITGGVRDLIVPPQLTNINKLEPKYSIHAYSTEINGLHREMDHLAIIWGKEFLAKLAELLKFSNKYKGFELIKRIKSFFQSDISKMILLEENNRQKTVLASKTPLEFTDKRVGIKLSDFFYYIVPNDYKSLIINNSQEILTQKMDFDTIEKMSLFEGFFGIRKKIVFSENLATFIRTGSWFSQTRFPLRINVEGEGRIRAVHAKCGHEEIVKYEENNFVLYFHESCENGPEIWIFGYDTEHEYMLNIKIDILGMLVCMSRDFRLHIFNCAFFLYLTGLSIYGLYIQIGTAGFFYFFGEFFRSVSYLYWETPHDQNIEYTVFDIVFLYFMGKGVVCLAKLIFEVLFKISTKFPLHKYLLLTVIPLGYSYTWIVFMFLLVFSMKDRKIAEVVYLSMISILPQQIGWYIAYFSHHIFVADYSSLPALGLLITQFYFKTVSIDFEIVFVSVFIGLCSHDLLYRTVFLLQLLCLWVTLKHLVIHVYNTFIIRIKITKS